MPEGQRARPQPTPETMHFWDGTRAGRIAPAALRCLPAGLFPAAPVLPALRGARGQRVPRQRPGPALQLCDPPPAGAGLHPALRDRRRRTRRGAAHDDQHRRLPADPRGAASSTCRSKSPSRRSTTRSPCPCSARRKAERDETEIDRHRRRRRNHRDGPHPRPVADRPACRRRAQRDEGCRAQASDIDGVATAGETPTTIAHYLGHHPQMGRRHRGRRLLVHDPCPPCRRGDRKRAVQDRADHPRRKRPLRHRAHRAPRCRRAASPASSKRPTARWARRPSSRSRCCAT